MITINTYHFYQITSRHSQTTTLDRQNSAENLRSAYSWYIDLMAFANNLDRHHIFKLDGSTFSVLSEGTKGFSVLSEGTGELIGIKQPNDVNKKEPPAIVLDNSNKLGILVKVMFLHNASGEQLMTWAKMILSSIRLRVYEIQQLLVRLVSFAFVKLEMEIRNVGNGFSNFMS